MTGGADAGRKFPARPVRTPGRAHGLSEAHSGRTPWRWPQCCRFSLVPPLAIDNGEQAATPLCRTIADTRPSDRGRQGWPRATCAALDGHGIHISGDIPAGGAAIVRGPAGYQRDGAARPGAVSDRSRARGAVPVRGPWACSDPPDIESVRLPPDLLVLPVLDPG